MVDIQPLGNQLWTDFHEHCKGLGVSGYHCIEADVTGQHLQETIGQYDIVHCSGVIYHVPDPFLVLRNLRSIVNEYLILTSMTVPSRIKSKKGTLELEGGSVYFIPALSEKQRQIAAAHFEKEGLEIAAINGNSVKEWITADGTPCYGPWWWLWTSKFLKQMLEACGFQVIETSETWKGKAHSFLSRPTKSKQKPLAEP
jgi:hypothetical protein